MGPGLVVVLAALCVVLLVLLAAVLLTGARRSREVADLHRRLDALHQELEHRPAPRAEPDEVEYVITSAGPAGPPGPDAQVPGQEVEALDGRQFVSTAVAESLVRVVSLGYGVRRALSAENRNRIGFEMRRETRRARKERKRELRLLRRTLRAPRSVPDQDAA
ncbi:hypothetical protein [Nocardioides mesophilus]|uniref:Uncharacterized protein n=1 Tax=Nocardioides mesophilus TaxID=433659 RepID=A0A7G9RAA2_9ACTN|nr:hypothetical protein [Nocardioides mesophilus]QNN52527.1 hypothetical protein H9L09_19010 [Nocardioides mesophilus]